MAGLPKGHGILASGLCCLIRPKRSLFSTMNLTEKRMIRGVLLPFFWKQKVVLFVVSVMLLSCLSGCHILSRAGATAPVAKQGVLDLTSWDFSKNGSLDIDGQWEFYWRQLLTPADFSGGHAHADVAYLTLPAAWNDVVSRGEKLGGKGFATFRLRIMPGMKQRELALHLDNVYSAYRLWADGKLLVEYGVIGKNTATESPGQAFRQPRITIGNQPVELVLQVSNYHYREGGVVSSIELGTPDTLAEDHMRKWGLKLFLVGSCLIMGLYHMVLFLFRRKDRAPLYFGIYCLLWGGYILTNNSAVRVFYQTIPVQFTDRFDLICAVLSVPVIYTFLRTLYPEEFSLGLQRISWILASVFTVLGLATPTMTFTSAISLYYIFSMLLICYILVMLCRAIKRDRQGAAIILLGCLAIGFAGTNDMLNDLQIIHSMTMMNMGIFVLIFAQSCALSLCFSSAFTTVEHLSAERDEHIQALSRMDRLKDEFLANTSHELRTPLNGIIGLAESLSAGAAGPLGEQVLANLEMISGSGRRLNNLVNDILDFSRLKHRDLHLHLLAVDLRSIAEKVLAVTAPLARGKQLQLVNAIPSGLPLVEGDEDRLQQILFNLVGNAIKFTDQGEVTVAATPVNAEVEISVGDTGLGIPEAKLDAIFNAFEQVDGTSARNHGGIGLGLGISRHLVELHGGRLWAESPPGKGSIFRFTLPISFQMASLGAVKAQAPLSPALPSLFAAPHSPIPDPGPDAPRVLAVDDDPVNLQVVCNHLRVEGMVVTIAASGPEALALIEKGEVFDLVLLDVMMPGMTGFEVCRGIRRRYNPAELPVLMLTAKNRLTDLSEGLNSGANDYVGKPFAREELLARVNAQLKVRKAHEMMLENSRLRREIELRAQTELELRLGQRRLDGMLHALPEPVIAINESREIAFCNRVFTERFGYHADDLLGRPAQGVFGTLAEPLEAWFAALAEPEITLPDAGATFELIAADGSPWSGQVAPAALEMENEYLLVLLLGETPTIGTSLYWIKDLSQNRQRLQQLEETLNGLTPLVLEQHPGFIDELHAVDRSLAEMSRNLAPAASGKNSRQLIVETMQLALDLWAEATLTTKAELARRSGLWGVYVNRDGWERTQALDRYLALHTLVAKPRLKKVLLTCEFVMANAPADTPLRRRFVSVLQQLQREVVPKTRTGVS